MELRKNLFVNVLTNLPEQDNYEKDPKPLYEAVITKNYQIIQIFIERINQLYIRNEEYDIKLANLQDKFGKLANNSENFHYQFRATYLEIERRMNEINNDLSGLKNYLRMPSKEQPYESYLESDFFKQNSMLMQGIRKQTRTRTKKKNKTIILQNQKEGQQNKERPLSNDLIKKEGQNNINQQIKQTQDIFQQSKNKSSNLIVKRGKRRQCKISAYKTINLNQEQIQAATEEINSDISRLPSVDEIKYTIDKKIEQLQKDQNQLRQRVANINNIENADSFQWKKQIDKINKQLYYIKQKDFKSECNWNHINFDEIQRYLEKQIRLELHLKTDKKYMEQSLNNLKSAFDISINEILSELQKKIDESQLENLDIKINQIRQNQAVFESLNGLRIQNIHFESENKQNETTKNPQMRNTLNQFYHNYKSLDSTYANTPTDRNKLQNDFKGSSLLKSLNQTSSKIQVSQRKMRYTASLSQLKNQDHNFDRLIEKKWKQNVQNVLKMKIKRRQ